MFLKDIALTIKVLIIVDIKLINLFTSLPNIIPQFTEIVNSFPTDFTKLAVTVEIAVNVTYCTLICNKVTDDVTAAITSFKTDLIKVTAEVTLAVRVELTDLSIVAIDVLKLVNVLVKAFTYPSVH